jgi:hypothetical protein
VRVVIRVMLFGTQVFSIDTGKLETVRGMSIFHIYHVFETYRLTTIYTHSATPLTFNSFKICNTIDSLKHSTHYEL